VQIDSKFSLVSLKVDLRKRSDEPGATRFTSRYGFLPVAEFLLGFPFQHFLSANQSCASTLFYRVLASSVHRVQGGTRSLARRDGCHLIAVVIGQFTTEFGTLGV
jgi:hypothetical protein